MNNYLSDQQIRQYQSDGFLFPVRAFPDEQAEQYRAELEQIEVDYKSADLPKPVRQYIRVHSDLVMPLACDMALQPAVLDAVEGIIGPNIMVWSAEFFIKEANSPHIVSMHQDLTYWGFGETSNQVTAWIALSPSTIASGCMELVKSSHKNPILPHTDTHSQHNLLSRGQEVSAEITDDDKTHVELQPGEMSLHHGLCIHGSSPNTTDDRRIGFAIRYINPEARQQSKDREYAMLARGVDRSNGFIHYAPPSALFDATSTALYDEVRSEQARILSKGMKDGQQLYGASS